MTAHVRVNLVGKVNRCAVLRQRDNFAFRSEYINAIGEKIGFNIFVKLACVGRLLLQIQQRLQPSVGERLDIAFATAVELVSEDPLLGDVIHLLGANLKFNRRALRADHGGVQTLVSITFRNGNKVLKA